jgi:hypothetical protein
LADTKETLASVDFSIETTKAEYEKAKNTDNVKSHAVQRQVEAAKETYQKAKDMAIRVIEETLVKTATASKSLANLSIQ